MRTWKINDSIVKIRKLVIKDDGAILITALEPLRVGTYLARSGYMWKVEEIVSKHVFRLSSLNSDLEGFEDGMFLHRGKTLIDLSGVRFSLALDSCRDPIFDVKIPSEVWVPVYQLSYNMFKVHVDDGGPFILIDEERYMLEYGPNWHVPELAKKPC